jgi:hypothetical protein
MADNEEVIIPDAALEAATKAVEEWLMLYTLPANYTLDRKYNQAVADANSESIARAALQAALPHLLTVVSNAEELEALWIGSVVFSDGNAYQHYGRGDWSGGDASRENSGISLPAIVIHNANPYGAK